MTEFSRRLFLQTLLTIPFVACSNKSGGRGPASQLNDFSIPLNVESLDKNFLSQCEKQAKAFYQTYSKDPTFAAKFEKMELQQFQEEKIVVLEGMAVTQLMVGFVSWSRSV